MARPRASLHVLMLSQAGCPENMTPHDKGHEHVPTILAGQGIGKVCFLKEKR